jgi:hypothetical protein
MSRPIDELIASLLRLHPAISVKQLRVAHPGVDDDGLWFVRHPEGMVEVQVESGTGAPPFLVESDLAPPTVAPTVEDAVRLVIARLGLAARGGL